MWGEMKKRQEEIGEISCATCKHGNISSCLNPIVAERIREGHVCLDQWGSTERIFSPPDKKKYDFGYKYWEKKS